MKFYTTYRQIICLNNSSDKERKALFRSLYFNALGTIWPYIGLFSLLVIVFLAKYFVSGVITQSILVFMGGFIYFHFHAIGVKKLFEKYANEH